MNKVLIASLSIPYPLFEGGALAQYYFLDGLQNEVEYIYVVPVWNQSEFNRLQQLKSSLPNVKFYFCDFREKKQKKTLKGFLRSILKRIKIKKHPDIMQSNKEADDFTDNFFLSVDHFFRPSFVSFLNDIIKKEDIKIVQYDFYNLIDICFALPDTVKKIFIHHEVRFKRLQLSYDKSNMPDSYKKWLIEKTKIYELGCSACADVVVVFNEDDAELLRPYCKKVVVSPFAIPSPNIYKEINGFPYNRLLFVGGEGHTPNAYGLKWFLEKIYLPNIREIKIDLYIVGEWSSETIHKYQNYQQIHFEGRVPSIEPYFHHSIFVNPILSGAGLRTKVLHAMVNSVPVMSTRFGAEGCYTEEEYNHLVLFDSADEFVEGMKNTNFKDLAKQGYTYYEKYFSKERLLTIRKQLYI